MSRDQADGTDPDDAVFDGASPELAALLRSVDWAATPLGPVGSWSPVLRLMVPTILRAGLPAVINWGPEFVAIYNDAYAPVLGRKHPAVGQTTRQTWPEAWQWVRPRLERVYRDGGTVAFDDEQLILHRNGYPEECYFTFSQSPIVDVDGGIGGVLTVATETTPRVLSERRMRVVRELGALTAADTGGVVGTCRAAARVLATARESLPFAVMFLIDTPADTTADGTLGDAEAAPDDAGALQMAAGYGVASENPGSGETGDAADVTSGRAPGWAAAAASRATATGEVQVLHSVRQLAETGVLPGPLGPLLPDTAVVVPLTVSGRPQPVGAVVLGINPYRPLGKDHQSFIQLIVRQLRVNLTDADVHEREQRRLRLLADLDHARTVFLQNTSHELHTPLTLLLAPLQDLLARTADDTDRADLQAAVRAAERLRGIIDSQFDFTGAAPGALVPDLRPVDIAAVTVEAADLFNSAAEHAGLAFTVDVPTDPVTAVADRSMWATIVTNLVSNAVKYTATGAVTVRVRPAAAEAVLTVTDTGTGISRHHQAGVFERFYRAAPDQAAPGSGIGLALVADLVRAQHGRVDLHSAPGKGTTVTVTIPLGATAPGDTDTHPATARTGSVTASARAPGLDDTPPTVLIVEDDPDLRGYLTRLLTGDGWAVTAVPDAETAHIEVMSSPIPPDVVLTDVMLPGRSGLYLVGQLRKHPATSRMPILVLTARGGPDAAADGLAAGADDYISKPFSSRELLARIRTNHELHQLRETAVDAAEAKTQQVKVALDSNRVIGTATGIVMATYQLTAQQAFKLLTVASQNTNNKLRDIADTVTATGALPYRRTTIDDLLIRASTPPPPKTK